MLIQTALPQHYTIRAAVAHDFDTFAERELRERIAPEYPPHTRLANVVISGTDEKVVQDAIQQTADWLLDLLARRIAGSDGDALCTNTRPPRELRPVRPATCAMS